MTTDRVDEMVAEWHRERPDLGRALDAMGTIGRIGRLALRAAWDQPGLRSGNAWWLTAADGSGTYYFYAHLADFAPELSVGSQVALVAWSSGWIATEAPDLHPLLLVAVAMGMGMIMRRAMCVRPSHGRMWRCCSR